MNPPKVTDTDYINFIIATPRDVTATEAGCERQAKSAWRIEMYHRALKQQCLIERAQCRRLRPVLNHIGLCIRAFLRIESHCYRAKMSSIEAKTSIIREAVRAYLSNPRYLLTPTA